MNSLKIFFQSIFFAGYLFICIESSAQNGDINLLRSINPQNPNSFVWKSFTASAYPLSIATPVAFWIDGKVKHNKKKGA